MNPSLFRCHDYRHLLERWRRVARAARLEWIPFAEADGYELVMLRSRQSPSGGIYISAGIHGDEPAGTEGLLSWAQEGGADGLPCCLFPCLNPWGLVNNSRFNAAGDDLNRSFHLDNAPQIPALREAIRSWRFSLAMMLHEDYDGRGLYLYEIKRSAPTWGDDLLALAAPTIPIENRATIDGRRISRTGLIQRRYRPGSFPLLPEALYLHQHHSRRTFTFETPSEFALETRVRAHHLLISASVERALKEGKRGG